MFTVGYGWLLLLPLGYLSKGAWIDENALQPSQVSDLPSMYGFDC